MLSREECNDIFDQLVQMLYAGGREDVIVEVKEQIANLDAVPAKKWIEATEHFLPQTTNTVKKKTYLLNQRPLPFIEAQVAEFSEKEPSSLEDLEDGVLSDYFYPSYERLMLLLRAIEAAYSVPVMLGLTALDLLQQQEIRFEATSQREVSFTLSHAELQQQEEPAQKLIHSIEQLRQYIQQAGESA
jgi:hypothetical protein